MPHITFKDNSGTFMVTMTMVRSHDGALLQPYFVDIYTYERPYGNGVEYTDCDSFSTWAYDTNFYGVTSIRTYEWYANEQDAINRFRELFLSLPQSAFPSYHMRRFIRILSTRHVVNENEPYFGHEVGDHEIGDPED